MPGLSVPRVRSLTLLLALPACAGGDDSGGTVSATEATGSTSEATTEATETTTTVTTMTTMTTMATTDPTTPTTMSTEVTLTDPTTDTMAVCGNGVVEPGEMCDDGNQAGGDGCEGDCTLLAGGVWWQEEIDGGDMDLDAGHDVAVDEAGNVYVVATTVTMASKSDIFIRKYDPIGVSIWTRTYDGGANQNDLGLAIAGDPAGFMVVAGRQTLQGQMGSVSWLSKCDPNGQILWQTTQDAALAIGGLTMFSNTHFIAVGSIKEGMDTNALIRRYDGQPAEVWTATIAGADGGPDSAADVAVNGAGDLFVVGREFTDAASFNAWLARYSPGGQEVWRKSVDGPVAGADWASAVAVSDEGWLVVGGRMDGGPGALGDAWLARYDVDGGEVWSQADDGPTGEDDAIRGLAIDAQGMILAVGHRSAGQGTDAWLRKLSGDGVEIWDDVIDGPGHADDEAVAVAVDGEDNMIAVGTLTITNGFNTDVLLTKRAP